MEVVNDGRENIEEGVTELEDTVRIEGITTIERRSFEVIYMSLRPSYDRVYVVLVSYYKGSTLLSVV